MAWSVQLPVHTQIYSHTCLYINTRSMQKVDNLSSLCDGLLSKLKLMRMNSLSYSAFHCASVCNTEYAVVHTFIHASICIGLSPHLYTSIHVQLCIHVSTHVSIRIFMHTFVTCLCTCLYMCMCMQYVHVYVQVHTHTSMVHIDARSQKCCKLRLS